MGLMVLIVLLISGCASPSGKPNVLPIPLLPVVRSEPLHQRSYRNEEDLWAEKALADFLLKKMMKKGREPVEELDVSSMNFKEVSRNCEGGPVILYDLTEMRMVETFVIPFAETEPFFVPSTEVGKETLILTRLENGEVKVLFNAPVLEVIGTASGNGADSCPDLVVRLSGTLFHRSESRTGFAKLLYDPGGYRLLRGVNGIPLEFDSE